MLTLDKYGAFTPRISVGDNCRFGNNLPHLPRNRGCWNVWVSGDCLSWNCVVLFSDYWALAIRVDTLTMLY